MVPDENSMEDPLCNSSFGSMVSLDYVTPDTTNVPNSLEARGQYLNGLEKLVLPMYFLKTNDIVIPGKSLEIGVLSFSGGLWRGR